MVSYAITYKTVKSDMLHQTLKSELADGLALSFVPPISDFINFKVWTMDCRSYFCLWSMSISARF